MMDMGLQAQQHELQAPQLDHIEFARPFQMKHMQADTSLGSKPPQEEKAAHADKQSQQVEGESKARPPP